MSRIQTVFQRLQAEGRKALIPFITTGDPDLAATLEIMHAMVAAGADVIELGVPFSDPMADGPTIQRASERALRHNVSLADVLGVVSKFRQTDNATAVVLMGYANPIEAMGFDAFAKGAAEAGVDGVLVVDYPPQECEVLGGMLKAVNIDPIFLLAPTSTEARMEEVGKIGSGYIYYVSLKGVTGAGHLLNVDEVARRVPLIRQKSGLPVAVGFGIRDGESAARIGATAEGVVIGSRLVEEIEQSPREELAARVGAFIKSIRSAMDAATQGAHA
ncbi:tryptophan synthase subunit alpha [Uliginosibacterium sp. sgz301328]|uniref:tryptophan synthase subunit alpha n=1 Tax=Uliginosibacterium sp. sgz301328 TaxID=3243764 RepID=UPI00359DCB0E